MHNFKSAKLICRAAPSGFFLADEMSQLGILNRLAKLFQLAWLAFDDQFDSSVRQISYRARHFEAPRHRFDRVAKPDALHPPGIKNM